MKLFSPSRWSGLHQHGLFALGLSYFLFIFFKNAWVADDAYIAFRSVEQLWAGNGPRWNVDERVQVYTSPLWFLGLVLSRLLVSELFIGSIALSALCAVGSLWVARKAIADDQHWLLFVGLITGAWCVMDFSTSGLENPLLYGLLAIYLWHYRSFLQSTESVEQRRALKGFFLCIGLLSITRHDVATLIFIPSVYLFYRAWNSLGWRTLFRHIWLLVLPFLLWTSFSVVYYGVPFPNTAYAKMMHGIPRNDLLEFGQLYLWVSFRWDYVAQLIVLFLGMTVVLRRGLPLFFLAAGVLLNIAYILYVGGDFMQGRFISMLVFYSALVFSLYAQMSRRIFSACVVLVALATVLLHVPLKQDPDDGFDIGQGKRHFSWQGILNERNFYFKTNSLWAWWHRHPERTFPDHKWCHMGQRAAESGQEASDFGGIGMYGYCAGLDLMVIDRLGLGEPFLARLPKHPSRDWRAGHFYRDYPRGFHQSRLSGENHLLDPVLAALWDDVALLTRAPLFGAGRWQAIWRINTGYYKEIAPYYFADIEAKQKE